MDGAHAHPWKALWALKSRKEQNISERFCMSSEEYTATCCGWVSWQTVSDLKVCSTTAGESPGGMRKDISNENLQEMVRILNGLKAEIKEITDVFIEDSSVKNRMTGVGVLTKEEAMELCAVGPTVRGSGVRQDIRLTGDHGVYKELGFEPCVEEAGDCMARTVVRIREIFQSIELIEKAVEMIPDGPVDVKVPKKVDGEFAIRLEQPRGEAFYYAKGQGTKFLKRMRVRTPTNINIPALVKMLAGADLADVPILVLTIDPCISCTER